MTSATGNWVSQALATGLALLLVLGLAWLVLRTLRRWQPGTTEGNEAVPRVVHSHGLGPRERLVLVRHRDREYLLGVGPGGIAVIDRWEGERPPPPARQPR